MSDIVSAHDLRRRFGNTVALDGVDLAIERGSIVGLIGPNGAGKTTLLRALLGLGACEGGLEVLGRDPLEDHAALMEEVSFIADTAVLPRWMRVSELLDYVNGVHPKFDRGAAERFLSTTEVGPERRVRDLSKGMTVQLHLALVMAIEARLLILDEPTLGLDLLFRKRFFEQLLNDYFDEQRTIIISTHQVEEVEHILTHVVFMDHGRIVLQSPMAELDTRFTELHAVGSRVAEAQAIGFLGQRSILGGKAFIYEGVERSRLEALGECRTPALADLFIATVEGARAR
jgi:ABC-2 type transport system ATP-binding protein